MKTYDEMIRFTAVASCGGGRLRYQKWSAAIILAEVYGKTELEVHEDLSSETVSYQTKLREEQKNNHRESNEQRRLANLAKWKDTQP